MGRKIPGRKHHGVRDPEKQQAERFKKIKDKINAPPSNPDDQQMPKSLLRFAELQQKVKNGDFKRKRVRKSTKPLMFNRGELQQQTDENEKQFMWRVQKHVNQVKHETKFANKFRVDIKRDKDGEVVGVEKRGKDPLEVMVKEAKQAQKEQKKKKKKKKEGVEEPRLTKSQKRQVKISEKKTRKQVDKMDDFEEKVDHVKFGEQAHAPPTLTIPKKHKIDDAGPGRNSLLLKSMLDTKKTANKVIDRTAKRKTLPNAVRRQLDRQQQEIVEAYRSLKLKKQNPT